MARCPPILVAIVQFQPEASAAMLGIAPQVLWTIGWILAVQQTIGNVITPKVMGDSMNLSPVIILTSLLMWGWLWGVAGALLSMPIAGIMSDQSGEWVMERLNAITKASRECLDISEDVNPVMTLSFMSLCVIPEIKLTDRGLFDVPSFQFIPVEVNGIH